MARRAGVAAADLTFATGAVLGGAALARSLHRWEAILHVVAVSVLVVVGIELVVRAIRTRPTTSEPAPGAVVTRTHRRLAPRFYAMTMANPLTVAAFASLVLASGTAASGGGWVLGIAVASFLVHVSLVALGSGLGRAIGNGLQRWLRACGGTVVLGLALVMAFAR